jgi:hypothetical protein
MISVDAQGQVKELIRAETVNDLLARDTGASAE